MVVKLAKSVVFKLFDKWISYIKIVINRILVLLFYFFQNFSIKLNLFVSLIFVIQSFKHFEVISFKLQLSANYVLQLLFE